MTVGELKQSLADVPDDFEVYIGKGDYPMVAATFAGPEDLFTGRGEETRTVLAITDPMTEEQ